MAQEERRRAKPKRNIPRRGAENAEALFLQAGRLRYVSQAFRLPCSANSAPLRGISRFISALYFINLFHHFFHEFEVGRSLFAGEGCENFRYALSFLIHDFVDHLLAFGFEREQHHAPVGF